MDRYSKITNKNQREIVLLKGYPCVWGKCRFCDYIDDNSRDLEAMRALNQEVLSHITGEFGVLDIMTVQTGADSVRIVIVDGSAGIVPGIRIYARLHPERMDMVSHRLHAPGEPVRMAIHPAVGSAEAEEAVIDVHVVVSGIVQPRGHEQVGLLHDRGIRYVYHEGIP